MTGWEQETGSLTAWSSTASQGFLSLSLSLLSFPLSHPLLLLLLLQLPGAGGAGDGLVVGWFRHWRRKVGLEEGWCSRLARSPSVVARAARGDGGGGTERDRAGASETAAERGEERRRRGGCQHGLRSRYIHVDFPISTPL